MSLHSLTNLEIQRYYQNEPEFNGVYSRNNLPKIKDETYIINLDEYANIGTHLVAIYVKSDLVTFFDSFGYKHIPKEIKTFVGNNIFKVNISGIQAHDSIISGHFCIGFLGFMLNNKRIADFTSLFSPNN